MRAARSLAPTRPRRVGDGPVAFSTCTALARSPEVSFDVNAYYRELGVHWRANRGELRRAYYRLEGYRDRRLTYVLHQLLDSAVRRRYDAMPPIEPMMDRYVLAALMRAANQSASQHAYEHRDDPRAEEDLEAALLESLEILDEHLTNEQDRRATPASSVEYGHYLWQTDADDPQRLTRWQEHLIQAATRTGTTRTLAIGLHGLTPEWLVSRVGYLDVAFLRHDAEPTSTAADGAISSLSSQR
jgi:hypothetical protein